MKPLNLLNSALLTIMLTIIACDPGIAQLEPVPPTVGEIAPPEGFKRVEVSTGSFGAYLREFPLRQGDQTLYLYDGKAKPNQQGHYAILDIDVGTRDLQQCADAVMRLYGEYQYAADLQDQIRFELASGKEAVWKNYAGADRSRAHFRKYLNYVFAYANTRSLRNSMNKPDGSVQPGDVLVQAGVPYGHAMLVADVAKNSETGAVAVLLAQSFMPAQDIHIVQNRKYVNENPWYVISAQNPIETRDWLFYWEDFRRF